MSNDKVPQILCLVIPHHVLARVAESRETGASDNARATLEHMRELAAGGVKTLRECPPDSTPETSDDRQRVYDAGHTLDLPGRQVLPGEFPAGDVHVTEAWDGGGTTNDFLERVLERRSIDGRGMRLDSTVHYGNGFGNAMWNGRQMVYGDGDGRVFTRFTSCIDVIAHELMHGVIQHAAALGYSGQTGALNEHIADAFGMMVKQWVLGQSPFESDWQIGAGLFGPAVGGGSALRSLALPGSAYDDPILGRDPQPSHMRDYVHTAEDNGGVHINSGILNHGFYLSAMEIGECSWKVLGPIWYAVLTEQLTPDAGFDEFAYATVETAGELFGFDGAVQRAIVQAWADVGLPESGLFCPASKRAAEHRARHAAAVAARRRSLWHRDYAGRALNNNDNEKKERKRKS